MRVTARKISRPKAFVYDLELMYRYLYCQLFFLFRQWFESFVIFIRIYFLNTAGKENGRNKRNGINMNIVRHFKISTIIIQTINNFDK